MNVPRLALVSYPLLNKYKFYHDYIYNLAYTYTNL
jgi:hypothetical protein